MISFSVVLSLYWQVPVGLGWAFVSQCFGVRVRDRPTATYAGPAIALSVTFRVVLFYISFNL